MRGNARHVEHVHVKYVRHIRHVKHEDTLDKRARKTQELVRDVGHGGNVAHSIFIDLDPYYC